MAQVVSNGDTLKPSDETDTNRTADNQNGKEKAYHTDNRGPDNESSSSHDQTDAENVKTDNSKDDAEEDEGDALEAAMEQLGPFGLYQKYVMFMLCIPNLFAAMFSMNYVFVADQVPFRCLVPECEGNGEINFVNEAAEALLPTETRCRRYTPLFHDSLTCEREYFHQNDTIVCDDFVYEHFETTFAEFGLACREWLRTLVGTVRNSALPLALILTGYVSDAWGRRTAFCIFSAFAGVMGIIKAFSVNYQMYVTLEFFEAALGYGFNSAGYVMMVELARPSLRAVFACATGVAYGFGGVLFALIAWRVPYWRHLLWTIHAPALLLPLYWLLLDESPRWLYVTGKTAETQAVIRKAAVWNKVTVNDDIMKALDKKTKKEESQPGGNPWLMLLKSKVLMGRFLVCSWCWIATTFVYYGLTINSVSLSGDKYVNFALNMAMEIVASLLLMMMLEKFGRKRSVFVAFLLCGVACVTPYFISHTGTGLGLFFVGKLAISFAFNAVYVFTAELFPTRTRSSALAACSLVGRIGSILAPQTPLLSLNVQALVYGLSSLLAALAVLLVPETRRARLPYGVRDAERMRPSAPSLHLPRPVPSAPVVLSADT